MTNKPAIVHALSMYLKSPLSRLFWYFISFLPKRAAVHSLVLFILTLSHIIAIRVGLDLACMTCIFKKFIDLCDQTTGNKLKKDLGPFKIGRAVVVSNRSVNLPFDIRKILCYILGREKISEVFKCFRSATCHRSWLEGLLASGAEICLFLGRVVEKTRIHRAIWWTIIFQSTSILEAKARIVVWRWTKSLSTWSYSNSTVTMKLSQSTSR